MISQLGKDHQADLISSVLEGRKLERKINANLSILMSPKIPSTTKTSSRKYWLVGRDSATKWTKPWMQTLLGKPCMGLMLYQRNMSRHSFKINPNRVRMVWIEYLSLNLRLMSKEKLNRKLLSLKRRMKMNSYLSQETRVPLDMSVK
jgi:hypothetical protein